MVLGNDQAGGSPPTRMKPIYRHPEPYAALIAKLEELETYTHQALIQYPKMERHLLCADIRRSIAAIERLAVVAWKRYHKKTTLQELDVEVEVLRMWIRKSVRLRYITPHRYEVWAIHVNEIGRMVGGWLRSTAH